jgi:hypothetical protein
MSRAKKRRLTFHFWSFASYYLFCNNLICLRSEYDFLSKKHRWSMTKRTKARNVLIRKKTTTSCQTIIAKMSISIRRSNETSRTIYCVEKTNDTFFQNFSKKNFWSKIMMIRTLIISNTKKFSICWKKKILLKQHEQERQEIRRHMFDMSSSQVRETQIARFVVIAFYLREIETRLNDEFHHRLIIFEAQKNRVRFDVDDDRSLY